MSKHPLKTLATIAALSAYSFTAQAIEPTMILIGGSLNENSDIMSRMVDLAGGTNGRIGIITAGSYPYESDCLEYGTSTDGGCNDPTVSNSKMNGEYYVDLFQSWGIDAEWIPIDTDWADNANDPDVLNQMAGMTAYFFGGGDQRRYLESMMNGSQDSDALALIRQDFTTGHAMIAGTSAGAAVMSDVMITGGTSYNALRYGAYLEGQQVDADDLAYTQPGFNLFPYGLVDTHFSARGRAGRIIELAMETQVPVAYGIDEETALVIEGVGQSSVEMEVLGLYGVHRFDTSQARWGNSSYYELYDVTWTHATRDETMNSATGALDASRSTTNESGSASGSRDVFSVSTPRELANMGMDLALSTETWTTGKTSQRRPEYEVRLFKDTDFQSYGNGFPGFEQMRLDIYNNRITPEALPGQDSGGGGCKGKGCK